MTISVVRSQWASLHREADLAIPVKDVHPGKNGYGTEGTVVRGIGYRIISGWQELVTALNRRWYRSEGTYTVRGHEGETQFATDMNEVLRWNGGAARSGGFKPTAIIEVDLSGLPFKTLMGTELFVPKGTSPNVGTMTFDVGSGVGIVGPIPLERIQAVHVLKDGLITETIRGDGWKQRAAEENRQMDWRGDTAEMYGSEGLSEWRSWRAWVCATPTGTTLHRYINGGGLPTACAKRGLEIGWNDAWFEPIIQVFPLADEMAGLRDWQWPSTAVRHPKTGKKLEKCPGCWNDFAEAMATITDILYRNRVLPPIDSPDFARALQRYDALVADKYHMIRDPNFKVKKPAPRRW